VPLKRAGVIIPFAPIGYEVPLLSCGKTLTIIPPASSSRHFRSPCVRVTQHRMSGDKADEILCRSAPGGPGKTALLNSQGAGRIKSRLAGFDFKHGIFQFDATGLWYSVNAPLSAELRCIRETVTCDMRADLPDRGSA